MKDSRYLSEGWIVSNYELYSVVSVLNGILQCFLIKENVFSRGQFASQYNKKSTQISLTFLTIFK